MSERPEVTEQLSAEQLLDELAKQDEMAADPGLKSAADANSTLKSLKEELDTLASQVREPAPVVPFEDESDCRRVTELVEALGLEPTQVGQSQLDTRPSEQKPLGELGQYQLLAKLGQGGMGTVYKALHTRLDKIVAIKLLPEQKTSDSQAVARFAQEMRAVGKLEHANIVRAMDANEHEETHYLVMEYVDGVDLSDLVRRLAPSSSGEGRGEGTSGIPVADACELVRQAAVGLQHAHDHRLVHRDIKPSNLMLSWGQASSLSGDRKQASPGYEPIVKILDLGLARLHNGNHGELTSTGQMMGTIDYMAPEQTGNSHNVDIRADIYGLGATLFKLLCDRAPYADERHDTVIKKLNALATQPVPSIRERRQEVPEELSAIVTKMLAKEAGGRYATPQDVADALAPFCAGHDLALLLENATADDTQHAHDESKVATHESLRSGSVETDPTLDMPDSSPRPLGKGLQSSPHAPREELTPASPGRESEKFSDSIDSTQSMLPSGSDKFGAGLLTSPKPPTEGLQQGNAGRASGRPAVDQVARSGDLATTSLQPWYTNRRNQIITVAAALGGVLLLAAVTLFFQTKDGTIVVEIDDPEGLIQVTVDGEDIVITDKNAGEPIRLKPGDHKLNVTRAGLEFSTDNFTLKRAGKVVLRVELRDGQVRVVQDDNVIGRKRLSAPNYALAFDGVGNYMAGQGHGVRIPSLKYDGKHPLTLEAFVVPRHTAAHNGVVVSMTPIRDDIPSLHVAAYHRSIWTTGAASAPTALYSQSKDGAVVSDRPVHVAAVWTSGHPRLFVNGKQIGTDSSYPFSPAVGDSCIGLGFRGIIDEVRISKLARYDKDFTPLELGERFEVDDDTLALYHFDEAEGDVLHDASPNKHHGKIVGAKWVKAQTMLAKEPAQHRELAEYVLRNGGTVEVLLDPGTDSARFSGDLVRIEQLPDSDLLVQTIECYFATDEHASNLGELLRAVELGGMVDLANAKIDDNGLQALEGIVADHSIRLTGTQVTDSSMSSLAKCRTPLIFLDNTEISDAGLLKLNQRIGLNRLHIRGTKVTEAGVTALSKSLPNCSIEWDGGVIEPTGGDTDREVAEWVLSVGGSIGLSAVGSDEFFGTKDWNSAPIMYLEQLPEDLLFRVTHINFESGYVVEQIHDADLKRLAKLESLMALNLDGHPITDAGLSQLAHMHTLKGIKLGGTKVKNPGLHLSKMPLLEFLELHGTEITDVGFEQFNENLNLSRLYLHNTSIGDGTLAALKKSPNLKKIHMANTRCTAVGLTHLPALKKLADLSVNANDVGDEGALSIGRLRSLLALNMDHTGITDAGLAHLRNLTSLQKLYLSGNQLSGEAVADLSKALPNCRIEWDGGVIEPTTDTNAAEFVAAGDAAFAKGDLDGALEAYSQAIGKDADDAEGYRGRGWVYLNRDTYARALDDFNQAIRLDANSGLAFNGRGCVYIHLGKLEQALTDLNQAIRLMPGYAHARHARGVAHYELKKYDDAIRDLTEAIRLDPNYGWSYLYRSKAFEASKDTAKAETDRKKALELDPSLANQLPK